MIRAKTCALVGSLFIVGCWSALAETSEIHGDARARAQTLLESGERELAADLYRASLGNPALTDSEELETVVALSSVLLDRAHDEETGMAALHLEVEALLARGELLAEELSDNFALAELFRLRWLLRFEQNSLAGGRELLERALGLLEEAQATEMDKAAVYADLAYTLILSGEFERAIGYMRRGVVNSLEANDTDQLILDLYNIGDAYLKLGETAVSKRYFLQGIEPLHGERTVDYFDTLIKLSTILRIEGDLKGALRGHEVALGYFRSTGGYRQVSAQVELARDFLALGDLETARKHADEVASKDRAYVEQRIDAILVLLALDLREDRLAEAGSRIDLLKALFEERYRQTGSVYAHPLRQIEFAGYLVEYHSTLGSVKLMEQEGDRGIAVYRHVSFGLSPQGSMHLAWASRVEPFISRYIAALVKFLPNRVLGVLEAAYSQHLSRGFAIRASEEDGAAADIQRLDVYLAAEKAVVDANAELAIEDSPDNRSRVAVAQVLRDQARDKYLLVSQGYVPSGRAFAAKQYLTATISVPPGHLLLRYYSNKHVSFVLAKDSNSERIFRLLPRTQLEDLVASSVFSIRSDGMRAQSTGLAQLAKILPVSLITGGDYSRIVIITDDLTHAIPFAAINVNLAIEPYRALSSRSEVIRAPSAIGYYSETVRDLSLNPVRATVVIIADPVFDVGQLADSTPSQFRSWTESLSRLPNTALEAKKIEALYPPGQVRTYLGTEATSRNLMSLVSRSAKILHIATHGYFNPAIPDIVGIATSAVDGQGNKLNGFLSLSQLLSQPFYSNLVVISGCETMLGRSFPGLGVQSLTQGLIAQGAAVVVGTLWSVPDRTTSEFMHHFYEELLRTKGDAPAALASTRRKMMQLAEYNEPAFWAAFEMTSSRWVSDKNVFQ